MNKKTILLLTYTRDDSAQLVINHLIRQRVDFLRFNTDEFHSKINLFINMGSGKEFVGYYEFQGRKLLFEDIGVVWNRRIHDPNIGTDLDYNEEFKKWAQDETTQAMHISFSLLRCPIINPFEVNEKLKFNKFIQMRLAASLGFNVPQSCLTNSINEIKNFWHSMDEEMIAKKIKKGLLNLNGKNFLFHTSKIPKESMNDNFLQRMRFSPVFLQKHIPKKFDIRSIVVGDKVFSVAIYSQSIPEGMVDYRTAGALGKINDMKHEIIELGDDTNKKLIAFTKYFGLTFGAFDLILTPDDQLIFLEDNPNGQWAWLEQKTGVPISNAIADLLSSYVNTPY